MTINRVISCFACVLSALTVGEVTASAAQAAASASSGGGVQSTLSESSETFLLGNVLFALLHEAGHAIIGDFDVPLLGLEENSADTIAAVSLVILDRQHPSAGYSEALGVTALVQAYVWEAGIERENPTTALWAQHGLSAQRYARLVCLLYGSDPERYGWVATATKMEEIRAEGCEREWQLAERAVLWLRDNYGIPPGQRSVTHSQAVEVRYGPVLDATETTLLQLLQRRELLPRLADMLQTRFAFPEPLTLKLTHCRVPNAYWDPEYRELVLCYELMTAIWKLADRPEVGRLVEQFKAGRPQGVEIPQALVTWPVEQNLS